MARPKTPLNPDGRDRRTGKFLPGNRGGGRPRKLVEESYRKLFSKAVTIKDWELIIKRAVRDAKKGNAGARNFLASWLCGSPEQYHMIQTRIMMDTKDAESNPYEEMSDAELLKAAQNMLTGSIGYTPPPPPEAGPPKPKFKATRNENPNL